MDGAVDFEGMGMNVPGLDSVSVQTLAALANQKIDSHIVECTASNKVISDRMSRLELGIIAVLLGIIGVLWQNYNSTHPAVTTVTTSVTTSRPQPNNVPPANMMLHFFTH